MANSGGIVLDNGRCKSDIDEIANDSSLDWINGDESNCGTYADYQFEDCYYNNWNNNNNTDNR